MVMWIYLRMGFSGGTPRDGHPGRSRDPCQSRNAGEIRVGIANTCWSNLVSARSEANHGAGCRQVRNPNRVFAIMANGITRRFLSFGIRSSKFLYDVATSAWHANGPGAPLRDSQRDAGLSSRLSATVRVAGADGFVGRSSGTRSYYRCTGPYGIDAERAHAR